MSKRLQKAINIKIRFAGQVVTLADEYDRKTTNAGVQIWIKQKPSNEIQPQATIPDGTLNQYKHDRPEIVDVQWVSA